MNEPVWWHPEPWDFAHSTIMSNTISSTNDVTAGAYSGIAGKRDKRRKERQMRI
jgi:hypothetical protein